MFDIVIRRGDTLPKITKKIYAGGVPVDLTGYSVAFVVDSLAGVNFINHTATVSDAPNGVVEYQWSAQDSIDVTDDVAFAKFVATQGSDVLTVPNNRPMSILLTSTAASEYSYSGDPSQRAIDRVRFLLSDTNMDKALFTDSEIEFLLTEYTNPYAAAAEAAEIQSSRYTNIADKTVGPLSINYGDLGNRWAALAKSLRRRAGRGSGAVAIMTQSSTDHYFKLGQMDNIGGYYSISDAVDPTEVLP